jgi:NitT/TauT family transport system ATP-binding protein
MSLVSFRGVNKTFPMQGGSTYAAIRDFALDIEEGEFLCLLGPSGCGKTTILEMLAGFVQPSSGRIEMSGAVVARPGRDRAVVFQGNDSLYGWLTARENVAFGPRMRGLPAQRCNQIADQFLTLVGLRNQGHKRPSALSGGMKQRIQIARVLANEPRMLLMDEPFGALDAQTRLVLQHELVRIWRETGQTVLFITHDIDEAITLGTRVGVMEAGPGSRLKAIIDIDPAMRKDRNDPDFLAIYQTVQALIAEEVKRTLDRELNVASAPS